MTKPGRVDGCCKRCVPDEVERAFGLDVCAWDRCTCHSFKRVGVDRKVEEKELSEGEK